MSASKFTVIQCATCGKECRCKASQTRKYCSVVCCNAHPDTKASRARNAEKMRGRAKVKKNCLECDGEFEALASQVKRGKGLSCSWECSYKLRARKMSEDRKGKRYSPGTEFTKVPRSIVRCQNCGAEIFFPCTQKRIPKYCDKNCQNADPGFAQRISATKQGLNYDAWQNFLQPENLRLRNSAPYRKWRTDVFERDKYTCQGCGRSDLFLNADHIYLWSEHPEQRFNVDNGRTLCFLCHFQRTWGYCDKEAALRWGVTSRYRNKMRTKLGL